MIQCTDLSLAYVGVTLFEKVSFSLNEKERVGLVGRNGSGKTTILRLLTRQEIPDGGSIHMPKGYRLGYLDQHIRFTKEDVLDEACLGLPHDAQNDVYKAEALLFGLGFTETTLHSPISSLSGGFQLRLHLAKVLLAEPDCLLLDEPTNYLDILSLRFLKKFLQKWKRELILISHDREFMDSITTHTLGIHRAKMKKVQGGTENLFALLLQEEELYEKQKVTQEKKVAHLQSYIDRFGAKASKAGQAQARKKSLEKIPALEKLKSIESLDFSFHETLHNPLKLLEAKNLSFSYSQEDSLIKDFSLLIERSSRVAIVGKNGNGKSTLLSLLAQEIQPQNGLLIPSDNISFGYFGQTNIERLTQSKTVEEEIAQANPLLTYATTKQIAASMMFKGGSSEKKISVLSGGERSRVLLGKIVAKTCNLLLLDEPTHHLDVESIEALIDALEAFHGAIVIVTHSELLLRRLAIDTLVVCHEGRQEVFSGTYDEFLEKRGFEEEREEVAVKKVPQKEDRVARAELVTQRSRALKPLKNKMEATEKRIIALEQEQKKEQSSLEMVVESGDSKTLQQLMQSIGKRQKEIDSSFEELIELHSTYEREKNTFPLS